jgi:phytoene dehydrogenase-like protein
MTGFNPHVAEGAHPSEVTHSTGTLTAEQRTAQDARYEEGHRYDYVIIGTGISALTVGALLAHSGRRICMLEAHDIPGGYGHSFQMGDFYFCAQIHYIWGCGPNDTVDAFLRRIGLEEELTFELYDADGYDHVVLPDGVRVPIPYGYDRLAENIEEAFPGSRASVERFLGILDRIHHQQRRLPRSAGSLLKQVLTGVWRFRHLLRYRNKTLQQVFDECGLSKEVQAIFSANAGDLMCPPDELSVMAFAGLFGGYNRGAYYPTRHFRHYIDRLAEYIADHDGCHIYYETPVSNIRLDGPRVSAVETEDGKTFRADRYICNADPQQTAQTLIGWDAVPQKFRKALSYDYSSAGVVMYLGLKDIDLRAYGFGSYNVWHLGQWDMNKAWSDQLAGDFENPWMFISTATLHTESDGVAPAGMHVMELATLADYQSFRDLKDTDRKAYRKKKYAIANKMLDMVEEHYIPNLRDHIAVKVVGSSTTNEDYVRAPFGNAYGSALTPENVNLGRLKAETPWSNLWWCNASSGFPGFFGTTSTGVSLYVKLTGDSSAQPVEPPTDEALIELAKKRWAAQSSRTESPRTESTRTASPR